MFAFIFVAFGATFALLFLIIRYVPLKSSVFGKSFSPKLVVCRMLGLFDIGITLLIVGGTVIGLTAVTGVGMMVFNVATGIGISLGILLIQKIFIPRWQRDYKALVEQEGKV